MTSIESTILGLLETSSLPGVYKFLIKNLLSSMSLPQQEDLLKILFADQNNIKEIEKKKMVIYRKYAPMIDAILADPESAKFNPMILNFNKNEQIENKTEKTDLKLDALKNVIGA